MPTAVPPLSNQARIGVGQLAPTIGATAEALSDESRSSVRRFWEFSQAVPYFYRLTGSPVILDPVTALISQVNEIVKDTLKDTLKRIASLRTWQDGWNGYDALAPEEAAVSRARLWIRSMVLAAIAVERLWLEPNVTGSPDGEVVFEWWWAGRKVTVYVSAQDTEYVQVWGPDINLQMADGRIDSDQANQALWLWLTGGE